MRLLLLACALVVAVQLPARADDEGSEHTAALLGADADTLGVTVTFSDQRGWQMEIRPHPGDPTRTVALPLPRQHAHYAVMVAPGRAAVAFVETSAGMSKARPALAAGDGLAWVVAPDGKLLASWTYGQVLTKAELAAPLRSAGHLRWTHDVKATATGLELPVAGGKRVLVLDAAHHTLR